MDDAPKPHWQVRLSNGDLIADEFLWMDGGSDPDPATIDWSVVEGYLDDGHAAEAWWMVPAKVVHAPARHPGHDILLLPSDPDRTHAARDEWRTECSCGWAGPPDAGQGPACEHWLRHMREVAPR